MSVVVAADSTVEAEVASTAVGVAAPMVVAVTGKSN
jgi:hypothetical protein